MKMVLAIINYDDSQDVISSLMKAGFSITKLATTGGFLKAGNVTILIGLDESKLDECFDIIREHSSSRKQIIDCFMNGGKLEDFEAITPTGL